MSEEKAADHGTLTELTELEDGDCILVSDGSPRHSITVSDIVDDYCFDIDTIIGIVKKFNQYQSEEAGYTLKLVKKSNKKAWFENGRD